jgi:hypothetical protein
MKMHTCKTCLYWTAYTCQGSPTLLGECRCAENIEATTRFEDEEGCEYYDKEGK